MPPVPPPRTSPGTVSIFFFNYRTKSYGEKSAISMP